MAIGQRFDGVVSKRVMSVVFDSVSCDSYILRICVFIIMWRGEREGKGGREGE